jgi:DNA-binding CsgD family transcriptional regulator
MINPLHEAWPDMNDTSAEVRDVDAVLTTSLGAVSLTHQDHITKRELDALQVTGQYDTPDEASTQAGMSKRTLQFHLQMVTLRLREDNKDIPHFRTGTPSLAYVVRHEGLVSYPTDDDWNESLTHAQAITLKAVALHIGEDDTRSLLPSVPYEWWPRNSRTELKAKLGVPQAKLERIVGRAYEVGLFVPNGTIRGLEAEGATRHD